MVYSLFLLFFSFFVFITYHDASQQLIQVMLLHAHCSCASSMSIRITNLVPIRIKRYIRPFPYLFFSFPVLSCTLLLMMMKTKTTKMMVVIVHIYIVACDVYVCTSTFGIHVYFYVCPRRCEVVL